MNFEVIGEIADVETFAAPPDDRSGNCLGCVKSMERDDGANAKAWPKFAWPMEPDAARKFTGMKLMARAERN